MGRTPAPQLDGVIVVDGSIPFTGPQSMGGQRLTDLPAPVGPTDAVRQQDVPGVLPTWNCTASENVRDIVFADVAGDTLKQASAAGAATMPVVGFISSKPTATTCTLQTGGEISGFTGLVPGDIYYADTTLGQITNTAPTIKQIVGVARSATTLAIAISAIQEASTAVLLEADCLATDVVKDCVYITGPEVGGFIQTTKVDPRTASTMPAFGIIVSKSTSTRCVLRADGIVSGVYTGLTPDARLFVGLSGQLVEGASSITPLPAGKVYVQYFGKALSADTIQLAPAPPIIRIA